MYKKEIVDALKSATSLVLRMRKNECSIGKFLKEYGNFYYYEALDGHEADAGQREIQGEFCKAIEFHRRVQEEVVNLTYLGNLGDEQRYAEIGRISEKKAVERLEGLCKEFDIEGLMRELELADRS